MILSPLSSTPSHAPFLPPLLGLFWLLHHLLSLPHLPTLLWPPDCTEHSLLREGEAARASRSLIPLLLSQLIPEGAEGPQPLGQTPLLPVAASPLQGKSVILCLADTDQLSAAPALFPAPAPAAGGRMGGRAGMLQPGRGRCQPAQPVWSQPQPGGFPGKPLAAPPPARSSSGKLPGAQLTHLPHKSRSGAVLRETIEHALKGFAEWI